MESSDMKKQKSARRKETVYRKGKVVLDRWESISEHLRDLAMRFSRCEHEVDVITTFFAKFYLCGFSHGIAHGMLKARHPRARKVKYATPDDYPETRLARSMVEFYQRMQHVHPDEAPPVPVSRDN
jgi:hypothetical protein